MQIAIDYIQNNLLELIAALFGFLYVILAAKQNYLCWLSGIIMVTIYTWIFYHQKIYANMFLQIIYLFMSLYGFYCWVSKKEGKEIKVTKMDNSYRLLMLVLLVMLTAMTYLMLQKTNSTMLFADAITAAAGLVATWMQARKYIDNWLLFIPTDIALTYMFYIQGLYVTSILYFIYTFLAIYAYLQWRKSLSLKKA